MTSILTRGTDNFTGSAFNDVPYNNADVTYLTDGSYIVVWAQTSYVYANGVFYRHFNADGSARSAVVAMGGSDQEGSPSVAALSNGGYSITMVAGTGHTVITRLYDSLDNAGSSYSNSYAWGETASDTLANGYHVMVVTKPADDTYAPKGMYLEVFGSSGQWIQSGERISTSGNLAVNPDVAGLSNGNLVAVWSEIAPETGQSALYERILTFNGTAVTTVLPVEVPTAYPASKPSVAALADGYIVVWQQANNLGGSSALGQMFNNDGTAVGGPITLDSGVSSQSSPQVAALDDGTFVVVWTSADSDGTGIFMRHFDAQGFGICATEQVNLATDGNQDYARVAASTGGGFIVTWSSLSGTSTGLHSRAFTPATTLNGTQYAYGTADGDVLDGGQGGDIMYGGQGDDTYVVNSVGDVVNEYAASGTDTVESTISYTLGSNLENLTLLGSSGLSGTGNFLDNIILGNNGANVLYGLEGNDTIDGGAGNDTINGGLGDDVINGGNGNDTVMASDGWDYASGDSGIDTYNASSGNGAAVIDLAAGKAVQNHYTTYIDGFENVVGTSGNDTIKGNNGDNVIDGGAGADTMSGGLGDDLYYVDNAGDVVIEVGNATGGTDTVVSSVTFSLSGQWIENLTLVGNADINGTGNSLANTIIGNYGNNVIDGGLGADTMNGLGGNDTYYVDNAGDIVMEFAGGGTDLVYASISFSLVGQAIENLTLTGSGNTTATGNELNNVLNGNSGNNIIDGGIGADTMSGGAGNDTYYVDNAGDVVLEGMNQGTDVVNSSITFSLAGQQIENLILTGIANINATGNGLANTLTGNGGNNTLDGGYGADTLWGLGGADTFLFNAASGADTIADFSSVQGDSINIHAYTHGTANTAIITQVGANVQINLGGSNVITVLNTTNDATFQSHIVW